MLGFFVAVFIALMVPSPETVAARDGKSCPYGCLVGGDGWTYEMQWHDVVSLAVALDCEVGAFLRYEEGPATAWALVQNHYRYHTIGKHPAFGKFVRSYSACASMEWSSLGTKYSPRITPRADLSMQKTWSTIRRGTREFVVAFLLGMHENRWPGYVYVLTSGWEEHADPSWVGPIYTEPHPGRCKNAYYQDGETQWWSGYAVRIAPATTRERRFLYPGSTDADWPTE